MTDEIARPGKIIAVHLNYRSRAEQRGRTPEVPSYFLKPASSVATTGETLERPAGTELLAFEGEIALIIGTRARRVTPEQGWAAVSGVTAGQLAPVFRLDVPDAPLRAKWAVVRVDVRTPAGELSFEAIKPRIRDRLAKQLGENAYIRELRRKTYVDVREL